MAGSQASSRVRRVTCPALSPVEDTDAIVEEDALKKTLGLYRNEGAFLVVKFGVDNKTAPLAPVPANFASLPAVAKTAAYDYPLRQGTALLARDGEHMYSANLMSVERNAKEANETAKFLREQDRLSNPPKRKGPTKSSEKEAKKIKKTKAADAHELPADSFRTPRDSPETEGFDENMPRAESPEVLDPFLDDYFAGLPPVLLDQIAPPVPAIAVANQVTQQNPNPSTSQTAALTSVIPQPLQNGARASKKGPSNQRVAPIGFLGVPRVSASTAAFPVSASVAPQTATSAPLAASAASRAVSGLTVRVRGPSPLPPVVSSAIHATAVHQVAVPVAPVAGGAGDQAEAVPVAFFDANRQPHPEYRYPFEISGTGEKRLLVERTAGIPIYIDAAFYEYLKKSKFSSGKLARMVLQRLLIGPEDDMRGMAILNSRRLALEATGVRRPGITVLLGKNFMSVLRMFVENMGHSSRGDWLSKTLNQWKDDQFGKL